MQILSIRLKNIKSHRDTELTFSPGINVLSGPNGVGKSTIFEAIGFAMFGVDAQSFVGNVERFISIGAKRGEISIVFMTTGNERYQVSRTVGTPSKWLLYREIGGDFEVEEHKDSKETEVRLKELLGLNSGRSLAEQFELVIGPFQNDFLGPFVIKQPTKRRDKFDEILGIDAWRKTFNETKALASTIKAKIESLESAIGPLKEQVAELPERKEEHKQAKKDLEETTKELKTQQTKFKELEKLLTAVDAREKALKDLETEINTLKERIGNGKEKIGQQKQLISESEKSKKILDESSAGKQAYEKAEAQLKDLREKVKLQRTLEQDVASLKTQLGTLEGRLKSESDAIERIRQEISSEENGLRDRRQKLVVDEKQQELADSLPEIRLSLEQVRKQLGLLDGRRAGLQEGSEKLAEGICPFFQEPCLNIAERPPGDVFSAKFSQLDKDSESLAKDLERLKNEESSATKASDQVKDVAIQLKNLDEQLKSLDARRKSNEDRAKELKTLKKEQDKVRGQLKEKQEELEKYSHLQKDIDAKEKEKSRHQEARDLYVANQQQAEELDSRRNALEKYENFLNKLQEKFAEKNEVHEKASKEYDPEEHATLRRQKEDLGREIGGLDQKEKGLIREESRLAGEIDKLKKIEDDIAVKRKLIKSYQEKDELVKFLRNRVFRNVSAYLSERFREEISQRANQIYRIISEVDEELNWGENYRIVLRDMVDGDLRERADDQLSGGQTMSAVVALRLAMLQTIGARLAFFDEPTSNLDATRRENLAHAFRAIDVGKEEATEHWYDQLFLISHDVAFTEITDQIISLD